MRGDVDARGRGLAGQAHRFAHLRDDWLGGWPGKRSCFPPTLATATMAHYVFAIHTDENVNRELGEFSSYEEASDFAKQARQGQNRKAPYFVAIVHAVDGEKALAIAQQLKSQAMALRRNAS